MAGDLFIIHCLWASLVAQMVRICLQSRRPKFDPWVRDPLEKGMATQSGILVWRIPCTEEHGGLTVHKVMKSHT